MPDAPPVDPVNPRARVAYGLVVHGGAGTLRRDEMTPERDPAFRLGLTEALETGYRVLRDEGTALDAVEASIRSLEACPLFNAGRGAVYAHDGTHRLDASIMDGARGAAGAVADVTDVAHPISLARRVMEQSPHVFLVGAGASAFAREQGIPAAPPEHFHTDERLRQLERARARDTLADDQGADRASFSPAGAEPPYGTVGAVALDRAGRLAAGTSTGGMTNKRWGRVGDSPVIGAGTFADRDCAVSGTGWGEYFIRNVVAYDVCARVRYRGVSLARAAHETVMEHLESRGSRTGGVIGMDRDGCVVWPHNTPGMYRGYVDQDGRVTVAIYREEG